MYKYTSVYFKYKYIYINIVGWRLISTNITKLTKMDYSPGKCIL